MHSIKWRKPIWEGYIWWDSNYMTFWKRQHYENKKINEPGVRERTHRMQGRFLGQGKYSVWYFNDGYKSLHICPQSQKVQYQEWILKVNDGLWGTVMCQYTFVLVANIPLLWVVLIKGELCMCGGSKGYMKNFYFPLDSVVNLKCSKKIKS